MLCSRSPSCDVGGPRLGETDPFLVGLQAAQGGSDREEVALVIAHREPVHPLVVHLPEMAKSSAGG